MKPLTSTPSTASLLAQQRSRTERTRDAILSATFNLLKQRGFTHTTVDAIAANAEVSKATIYSHWASKTDIVVELLGRVADDMAITPDTGDLRTDLLQVLERLVQIAEQVRGLAQSVVAEAVHDPVLAAALAQLTDAWRRHERELVERSLARKLIPDTVDQEIAVDLVVAPVYFRLLFAAPDDPADDLAARLVDPILRAWGYQPTD
jgi:AcrR family transcriptional regulator